MKKLTDLFAGQVPPGVYTVDGSIPIPVLSQTADHYGFRLFHLDGQDITDTFAFLDRFAAIVEYPNLEAFGRNWGAFLDVLEDLEWLPAKGYVLVYDHFDQFARSEPQKFQIAIENMRDAVAFRQKLGVPLFVLLRGDQSVADRFAVPKLDLSA